MAHCITCGDPIPFCKDIIQCFACVGRMWGIRAYLKVESPCVESRDLVEKGYPVMEEAKEPIAKPGLVKKQAGVKSGPSSHASPRILRSRPLPVRELYQAS